MNTTPLATLFDRAAQAYDAERHMLVPCFEGFYSAGVEAVGPLGPGARLMDLGAGTGLFSALVAAANPGISVTLVDIAAGMLAEAEKRFAAAALPAPEIVVADYAETLPAGSFDAIVSAVSIHHLETVRKARLLRFVAERLAPGGVRVPIDAEVPPELRARMAELAASAPGGRSLYDPDQESAVRA
ncbi:MAG: class I SAM-dependent methyltransferase, partial [Pseudomonadota bacterium]